MPWEDHTTLDDVEPISSVSQIKNIIGRNLQYLVTLTVPQELQKTVTDLNSQLANSIEPLDPSSLQQIYDSLVQLKQQLTESGSKIDRQISAQRIILPQITPEIKTKLLRATTEQDIQEANIRFTTVESIITNINKCMAGMKKKTKLAKGPSVGISGTVAKLPNSDGQREKNSKTRDLTKVKILEELNKKIAERKLSKQKADVSSTLNSSVQTIVLQEEVAIEDFDQSKITILHDRDSMAHLDQEYDASGELSTANTLLGVKMIMQPKLEVEVSSAEKPSSRSSIKPGSSLPTSLLEEPPPLAKLPSSPLAAQFASLGTKFTEEYLENIKRHSVLNYQHDHPAGDLVFDRKKLCTELQREYSENGNEEINFIDSYAAHGEPVDKSLSKELSFSDDGKTVTLPDDNIINDTVYALNTIARSNMLNHDYDMLDAKINIKQVQEQDLLKILQEFNKSILEGQDSMGLKGYLQLSYENPVHDSPNEQAIQKIIEKHNALHSSLASDNPLPEQVKEQLSDLTRSIEALQSSKKSAEHESSVVSESVNSGRNSLSH